MKMKFQTVNPRVDCHPHQWNDWRWQLKSGLKSEDDFAEYFELSLDEKEGFREGADLFRFRTTPYYASLASKQTVEDPVRKILMPSKKELSTPFQGQLDPLGENLNRPAKRIIHRYSDRVLFLVTDFCSVYCRYCTRKHFTGKDQALPASNEYDEALSYIKNTPGLREVILSGGDPLTLSDQWIEKILSDLRSIEHVEIIRIGSRMPVVCPMRITDELLAIVRKFHPVYLMTHFNHPRELTTESAQALERCVDAGIPTFNQMVLLNGVNNHASVVQALSRRLLYLRVKPYYMFQCDPSIGSDHLRTSVEESRKIQKELWGHLSGLALPNLSLDLPSGGGKVGLVPDFNERVSGETHRFTGWDGIEADYVSPSSQIKPIDVEEYMREWDELTSARKPQNF